MQGETKAPKEFRMYPKPPKAMGLESDSGQGPRFQSSMAPYACLQTGEFFWPVYPPLPLSGKIVSVGRVLKLLTSQTPVFLHHRSRQRASGNPGGRKVEERTQTLESASTVRLFTLRCRVRRIQWDNAKSLPHTVGQEVPETNGDRQQGTNLLELKNK